MKLGLDGYIPPLLVFGAAFLLIAVRRFGLKTHLRKRGFATDAVILLAIVVFAGSLELEMGRTPTYQYGPVRVWSGDIHSNENSQQIADPYTLTHLIHGAAFYGLTRAMLGAELIGVRVIVAVTAESAWEVFENTDMVIKRYRVATTSLDYYGDSVLNSVFDILASLLGFCLAWRLPMRVTAIWIVLIELVLVLWVRDNLTLNILMLIYPIKAVEAWQMGG